MVVDSPRHGAASEGEDPPGVSGTAGPGGAGGPGTPRSGAGGAGPPHTVHFPPSVQDSPVRHPSYLSTTDSEGTRTLFKALSLRLVHTNEGGTDCLLPDIL